MPRMAQGLLFGTGGVPLSARATSTEAGIERIAELGLGCMEVEFVRGVHMKEDTARAAARLALEKGVRLSVHAPYFVNLNAREQEKRAASRQRVLHSARVAHLLGAESVVFHAAFYLDSMPQEAWAQVKASLEEMVAQLKAEGNRCLLRPETMGRASQLGTLEEVLALSAQVEGVAPCIDFAHLHARSGGLNSYPDFVAMLRQVEAALGRGALDTMHIHMSGIQYGAKGEVRHLNMEQSDMSYVELLRALKELGAGGLIICESPNLEEDALLLQETYRSL